MDAARARVAELEKKNAELKEENENLKKDDALAKVEEDDALLSTAKPHALAKNSDRLTFTKTIIGTLEVEKHNTLLKLLKIEFGQGDLDSAPGFFRFRTKNPYKFLEKGIQVEIIQNDKGQKLTIKETRITKSAFVDVGLMLSTIFYGICSLMLFRTRLIPAMFGATVLATCGLFNARTLLKSRKQHKRFVTKTERVLNLLSTTISVDETQ